MQLVLGWQLAHIMGCPNAMAGHGGDQRVVVLDNIHLHDVTVLKTHRQRNGWIRSTLGKSDLLIVLVKRDDRTFAGPLACRRKRRTNCIIELLY